MVEGLLSFLKTPEGQGLLSAGAGYMANASRTTPVNSIGRGALTGLLGYGQAMDRQDRSTQEAQERQIRAMQLKKAQDELTTTEGIRAAARNAYTPATPSAGGLLDSALPPEYQTGAAPVPGRPAAFDTTGFLGQVMQLDPIKGMDWQTKLKPETPFGKVDPKDYTPASVQKFAMTGKHADLVPARKLDVVNNQAVNLYETQPGTTFDQNDPNQPFGMVGGKVVPNQAYQTFAMNKATASAPKMPAINLSDPTAVARAAMDMQNQVRTAFKDHYTIADQYGAIQAAAANPSPQGDTALLYSFFKVLDPTSTVREGEVAMVKDNRSIPDKFKGMAQRLAGGGGLLPHERQDIMEQAKRQVDARVPRARNELKAYRDNATRLGLDPDLYAPDPYKGYGEQAKTPPKAVPLPSAMPKASELSKGTVYDTPRGPAVWDGMKFNPV